MKVSGFTIIRNAIVNDYPVVEAISSILPLVDEMIVLVGDGNDDTETLIRSIGSDKIRIHHSVWDPQHFSGGKILAIETDKAFQLIDPQSDWAFYIQADEVIHEKYHPAIRQALTQYRDDPRVEGLLFSYIHFYGTYDYVGDSRRWYNHEIRIIRNDQSIHAYRDAQGFRKNGRKLQVKPIEAVVHHYGWVKSPAQMLVKNRNFVELWREETEQIKALSAKEVFDFTEFDSIQRFAGTHPAVMRDRIRRMNWELKLDLGQKKFSPADRLLYWFEKITGKRLFDYKNYRIIP